MKKWFDYQMKNQVRDHQWDIFGKPINNVHEDFLQIANKIKEKFYTKEIANNRSPNFLYNEQFFNDNAESGGLDKNQLKEMIQDPVYLEFMQNEGVNSYAFDFKNLFDISIKKICAKQFDLDPDTILLMLNVQKPGQYFALHIDRVRWNEFNQEVEPLNHPSKHVRYIVFFDDWQYGQVFQMGENFIKWKAGDVFTWNPRDVPHGSANFGYHDRFVLVVTGQTIDRD